MTEKINEIFKEIHQIYVKYDDGLEQLDNTSEDLIKEVIEKAINYTRSCDMLPNIDSNVFKNWLKVNKYAETINRLIYSKKGLDYDIDILYRAFTNEIEFGN